MSRGARGARMRWGVPTGVVLGVVLVLVVAMVAGTGSASTTGYQPVKGLPFKEPARIVSSNGVLRATLVAEERKVTVSGDTILARVYNGAFTGPTLVVKPGTPCASPS